MRLGLEGKRVLITGGNSGLGAAMAAAFAGEGASVAINHVVRADAAQEMVERFAAAGSEAIAIEADISDRSAVEAMFRRVDEAWGGIDILVNNAGLDGKRAVAWEGEVDAWLHVIRVNLQGAYLCAREALKRMVPQRSGVILNTSSVHEVIPWSGHSAYVASKAGLSGMAKTLAQEAAPYGVRVVSIAPGAIETPINRDVREDPAGHADLLSKIPLGRIGRPEDVANLALVLASDAAGYVTGTTVFVDGGMTTYADFAHGG